MTVFSYFQTILREQPSSYWRFDELSGTVVFDFLGSSNLTLSGGVTLGTPNAVVDNLQDYAVAFSAATSGQLDTTAVPITSTGIWTIEGWVRPEPSVQTDAVIVHNGLATSGYGFALGGAAAASNKLYGIVNNSWIDSGGRLELGGEWHHVVMTRDGSTIRWYINGNQTTATSSSLPNTPASYFTIGYQRSAASAPQRWFSGSVDEVAIYSKCLGEAQIRQHYLKGIDYARNKPWVRGVAPRTGKKRNVQVFKTNYLLSPLLKAVEHDNTNVPTLTVGSEGNLNGTYRYKITFCVLDEDNSTIVAESSSSPLPTDSGATQPITVRNKQIVLSNIPVSAKPHVNARRIYRTTTGDKNYYLVTTIPNNTVLTYTDNVPDVDIKDQNVIVAYSKRYIGTGVQADIDLNNKLNGLPPKVTLIKTYGTVGVSQGMICVLDKFPLGSHKVLSTTGNLSTGVVQSITKTAITVTTANDANQSGSTQYLLTVAGDGIETGVYVGDGNTSDRRIPLSTITNPKVLWVIPNGGSEKSCWHQKELINSTVAIGGGGTSSTGRVTSMDTKGFTVGSVLNVSNISYYYVAFTGDGIQTGAFTGGGVSAANYVDIPGPSMKDRLDTNQYDNFILLLKQTNGINGSIRFDLFNSTLSVNLSTRDTQSNFVTSLTADRFTYGSNLYTVGKGAVWCTIGNKSMSQVSPTYPNTLGLPHIAAGGTSLDRPALAFGKSPTIIASLTTAGSTTMTPPVGELWQIDRFYSNAAISALIGGVNVWTSTNTAGNSSQNILPFLVDSTKPLTTSGTLGTGSLNFVAQRLTNTDNARVVCQTITTASSYTVPANYQFVMYGVHKYTTGSTPFLNIANNNFMPIEDDGDLINNQFPAFTMPVVVPTTTGVKMAGANVTAALWGLEVPSTL